MTTDKILNIAKTCHEVNRAYCIGLGDNSQLPWEDITENNKKSLIDGVNFLRKNPKSTPEDAHNNWLDFKIGNGWSYGKEKSTSEKTHPCMVRYRDLPKEQRIKDILFAAVVKGFK